MDFKTFFHYMSYIQYPLLVVSLYFAFQPYFIGLEYLKENPNVLFESINSFLIFAGLAISFSSLQDTTKTQNKLSRKVWEDPVKGKIFIFYISFLILALLAIGLVAYYFTENEAMKNLSVGIIVLGLGMFGFLKAGIEIFENHRKDKKQQA